MVLPNWMLTVTLSRIACGRWYSTWSVSVSARGGRNWSLSRSEDRERTSSVSSDGEVARRSRSESMNRIYSVQGD